LHSHDEAGDNARGRPGKPDCCFAMEEVVMKKGLIFVDILMIGFLLLPLAFVVFGELRPEYFTRINGKLSDNTVYMLISFIPCMGAFFWLIVRYSEGVLGRYPFLGTSKFRVITTIAILIIVFVAKTIIKSIKHTGG
jgi:hypothetical protein